MQIDRQQYSTIKAELRASMKPPYLLRRLSLLQLQRLPEGELHARITMFRDALASIDLQLKAFDRREADPCGLLWRRLAIRAKDTYRADLAVAKAEAQARTKPVDPGQAQDRARAFVAAAKARLGKEAVGEIWRLAIERDPHLFPSRNASHQPLARGASS